MEALLGKTSYSEAKALLESAGLHPDAVPEKLYGVRDWEGRLTACAGANRNVIQYVAALKEARGEGAVSSLISFLVTQLREEGWNNVFLFT